MLISLSFVTKLGIWHLVGSAIAHCIVLSRLSNLCGAWRTLCLSPELSTPVCLSFYSPVSLICIRFSLFNDPRTLKRTDEESCLSCVSIWTVVNSHCRLHLIFCSHWFWTDKWIHPNSETSPHCEYTWCDFFLKLGTLFHYSCYYINSNLFKWLFTLPNYPISKEKSGDHFLFDETQPETTSELFGNVMENLQTSSVMISVVFFENLHPHVCD